MALIFVLAFIVIYISLCIYSHYDEKAHVKKLYNSLNIGDKLEKLDYTSYNGAPWNNPYVLKATVTKRQDNWIQITYEDGSTDDIEYRYRPYHDLDSWRKVNE